MSQQQRGILPSFVRERYTARLGIALAFAVVVVLVFGGVISTQATGELREDVSNDLIGQAEAQAEHLETWLSAVERDVQTNAQLSVFATDDITEIGRTLEATAASGDLPADVLSMHVLNTASMDVLASSSDGPSVSAASLPTDFADESDVVISEPFAVSTVDHPVVAVLSPIAGAEDRALVYTVDLQSRAGTLSTMDDTSTVVIDGAGQYVAHPNASRLLQPADEDITATNGSFQRQGETVVGVQGLSGHDWTVATRMSADQAYALVGQINADLLGLVLLAVINLGLVGVTIGSNTALSLRRLANRASEMGAGNLDVDLTTQREDEIGTLYRSFAEMRDSLGEQIEEAEAAQEAAESAREDAERERAEMEQLSTHLETKAGEYGDVLDRVAGGDLTQRVDPESDNDAMRTVGEELNAALEALERTVADVESFAAEVARSSDNVRRNADRVGEASRQVGESVDEIFDGANEQSERLQDIAEEMETLSASAQQVASSAQEVAQTSQQAAEVGESGRQAAEDAIAEMHAIEEETERTRQAINELDADLDEIGEIVDVITEIVEQTNMLAINASIEAAHSEGGEGFAVVADEVKNLAEETKDAAGDIEARIERVQAQAGETVETMEATSERMEDGVETVTEAVESLETIVEYAEESDRGIQEIDAATGEQAETAQDVMGMVEDLTAISQQTVTEADTVASAADEQTESITEVTESAGDLLDRAQQLQSLLDRFEADRSTDETTTAALEEDTL